MTKKNDRIYRSIPMNLRAKENSDDEKSYIVEGYASTFDTYELYKDPDVTIFEKIDRNAFDKADFTDCVFRVDHEGRVYARTSAGNLDVKIDDGGLYQEADLSRTSTGRELYEDIVAGNYPQMSFAFTVRKGHEEWSDSNKEVTNVIDEIDKVYDVSPVTWPANPNTELSARDRELVDGVIDKLQAERLEVERRELERKKNELKKRLLKARLEEEND